MYSGTSLPNLPSCAGPPPTRAATFKCACPVVTDAERACHAGRGLKGQPCSSMARVTSRKGPRAGAQPRPTPAELVQARRPSAAARVTAQNVRAHTHARNRCLVARQRRGVFTNVAVSGGTARERRRRRPHAGTYQPLQRAARAPGAGEKLFPDFALRHQLLQTKGTDLTYLHSRRRTALSLSACAGAAAADRTMAACAQSARRAEGSPDACVAIQSVRPSQVLDRSQRFIRILQLLHVVQFSRRQRQAPGRRLRVLQQQQSLWQTGAAR